MAETISIPVAPSMQAQASPRVVSGSMSIPWYIWCCMLAVLSSSVGSAWDISWHESIGRDTFWTPAHMLIYLCGVLSGISCGYVILSTSFAKASKLRGHSISMWGFAGPMGAFICAWGGVAMITSAPFDNWWHNAYGLDVKILSPPHVLLALGMNVFVHTEHSFAGFWVMMAVALATGVLMTGLGLGWGDWMRRIRR